MNEIDKNDIGIILKISKKYGCPGKKEISSIYRLQNEQRIFKGKIGDRYLERLKKIYDFNAHNGKCVICCKDTAIDGIICYTCHISVESAFNHSKEDVNYINMKTSSAIKNSTHSKLLCMGSICGVIVILLLVGLFCINKFMYINDLKEHVADPQIISSPEVRVVNDFCKAVVKGDDTEAMKKVAFGKLLNDCPESILQHFGSFFDDRRATIDYIIMDEVKSNDDTYEDAIVHVLFTYSDISNVLVQTYTDFIGKYENTSLLEMSDEQFENLYLQYSAKEVPLYSIPKSEIEVGFYCIKNQKEGKWVIGNLPDELTQVITCNYEQAKESIEFYDTFSEIYDDYDISDLSDINENSYLDEFIYSQKAPKDGRYVNGYDVIIITLDNDYESGYVEIYSYSDEFGMDIWIDDGVMNLCSSDNGDYYYYLKTNEIGHEYEIYFGYDEIIVNDLSYMDGYYLDYYLQN